MLNVRELMIKAMKNSNEVRVMESQEKQLEVCRVQPIVNGLPKLILTKPSCANKINHNAMPYNYNCTSNIKTYVPLFQTKISGLTQSGRCFTPKELRKAKGTKMVDLNKELEVNRSVTNEELSEFLKFIKHSEY